MKILLKKNEENLEPKNFNEIEKENFEIKENDELKNKEINEPTNNENENKNAEKNSNDENEKNKIEIKIVKKELNKEEIIDNNDKQFDVCKIKKLGSIEFTSNIAFQITLVYELKDERIACIIGCYNYDSMLSIINLKTNNIDINENLNIQDVSNLIQMDDGNLIVLNNSILQSKVSYIKVK